MHILARTLFPLLVACCACAEDAVHLTWRIAPDEVVGFRAAMDKLSGSSTFQFDAPKIADIVKRLGGDAGTAADAAAKLKDVTSKFSLPEHYSLWCRLRGKADDAFSVILMPASAAAPMLSGVDERTKNANAMMQKMNAGVQLRGEMDKAGGITSFYLSQQQKNLLAMLFELPERPVKIGDTWPLHLSLITMGKDFICSDARRVNRVELIGMQGVGKDAVAVLDYCISEHVAGRFIMPEGGAEVPTGMDMSFLGRGEFLIERGRWRSMSGVIAIKSYGAMVADTTQRLALSPADNLPDNVLKAE